MIVIGICGGSGSGKSTVAGLFCEYGAVVLDADRIYHEIMCAPGKHTSDISDAFGDVLHADGSLDRKKLASVIFSGTPDAQKEKQRQLNALTHPAVLEKAEEKIRAARANGACAVVFDVPLLFESGAEKMCDVTIAVTAPLEMRIRRIMKRDAISEEEARRRIATQLPDEYLTEHCGYHIINDADTASLHEKVKRIAHRILPTKKRRMR